MWRHFLSDNIAEYVDLWGHHSAFNGCDLSGVGGLVTETKS